MFVTPSSIQVAVELDSVFKYSSTVHFTFITCSFERSSLFACSFEHLDFIFTFPFLLVVDVVNVVGFKSCKETV